MCLILAVKDVFYPVIIPSFSSVYYSLVLLLSATSVKLQTYQLNKYGAKF